MSLKRCASCKQYLARCEFRVDNYAKDGLMYSCRKCKSARQKELHQINPNIRKSINDKLKDKRKVYYSDETRKRKYKHKELLKTYGISIEQFDEMLEKQNNTCAICFQPERSVRNKKLSIDHNHETGEIRGLLCSHCNRAIGLLKDNINNLKSAIKYLEEEDDIQK